jgi:hypothetical protein
MRVDATGRLFLTIDGVKVHGPDGKFLAGLTIPEQTANVCFGGANQEMLFITASSSLYGITRLPDLVVIAMGTSPSTPSAGQSVRFTATVKNQGTGATPVARPSASRSPSAVRPTSWSRLFHGRAPRTLRSFDGE